MPGLDPAVGDARVNAWLEIREPLERQLEPLGRAAMEVLDLALGERVLDIGCGVGGTPTALARAVGSFGEVVGIEVLPSAIDVVRRDSDLPANVSFLVGDAETYPFEPGSFDAAFSRFGVMFFGDPIAAFKNVLGALRPGGRLGFICWRGLAENELDELPLRAASPVLPAEIVDQTAAAAWFSFSEARDIGAALAGAGFVNIQIAPRDDLVGASDVRGMVDVCSRVGALGAILRAHPQLRRKAVPLVEAAFRGIDGPEGPRLRAATWVVTARAPD